MRIIFVTGGVISSLGKGLATASIASLIQEHGYEVLTMKLDPYLNFDSGNMNPEQHGEVFVTEDGIATDLDLGHYERFLQGVKMNKNCSITAGQIYHELIDNERSGKYLGSTVQVIPHVTDLIKEKILRNAKKYDFLFCEIGGTVGDIEALPFLEAIRQIRYQLGSKSTLFTHLTLLPHIDSAGEMKTKPTQRSVKELLSLGIQPDILLCRTKEIIPAEIKKKIAQFCNVDEGSVFPAIDVKNIYQIPIVYQQNSLDLKILNYFDINPIKKITLPQWKKYEKNWLNPKISKKVAIISKYNNGKESYKSLFEALQHAGVEQNVDVQIQCINVKEVKNVADYLTQFDGIIVPGGFGYHGTEDKIAAVQFARENKKPFLGICFGLQMMAIEFARNVLGLKNSGSNELTDRPDKIEVIIDYADNIFNKNNPDFTYITAKYEMSATMHIGGSKVKLKNDSIAHKIYQNNVIVERNRHRCSFNSDYAEKFAEHGMLISGAYEESALPALMEFADHPFFMGVQFHPELISSPRRPHPLFVAFVRALL